MVLSKSVPMDQPGEFFLSLVAPSDYVWLPQMVPIDHLQCHKRSSLPHMVPPTMQQLSRQSLTSIMKGLSKALYLRHVKGKLSCSS